MSLLRWAGRRMASAVSVDVRGNLVGGCEAIALVNVPILVSLSSLVPFDRGCLLNELFL